METYFLNQSERDLWSIHQSAPTEQLILSGDLIVNGVTNFNDHVIIDHVATEDNEKSLEIRTDSNGFGSVTSMNVFHRSQIPQFSSNDVMNVTLDCMTSEANTTMSGICVLGSGGLADLYAVKAGVNISPIFQLASTTVFDNAGLVTKNGITDITLDVSSQGAPYITVLENNGDSIEVWGANFVVFEQIIIDFEVNASKSTKPKFEYSTGIGLWQEFVPNDSTNGFRNNGSIIWNSVDLLSWAPISSKFGIRITRIFNGSINILPQIDEIALNSADTKNYFWDKTGYISSKQIGINETLLIDNNTAGEINYIHAGTQDGSNNNTMLFQSSANNRVTARINNGALSGTNTTDLTISCFGDRRSITLDKQGGSIWTMGAQGSNFKIRYDNATPSYLSTAQNANDVIVIDSSKNTTFLGSIILDSVLLDNSQTKLLVLDSATDTIEYRDVSSLPVSNPFDQPLNTTDNVEFNSLSVDGNLDITSTTDSLSTFTLTPAVTTGGKSFNFESDTSNSAVIVRIKNKNAATTAASSLWLLTDSVGCTADGGNPTVLFENCGSNKWEIGKQVSTNTFRWNYGPGYDFLTNDSLTKMFLSDLGHLTITGTLTHGALTTDLSSTNYLISDAGNVMRKKDMFFGSLYRHVGFLFNPTTPGFFSQLPTGFTIGINAGGITPLVAGTFQTTSVNPVNIELSYYMSIRNEDVSATCDVTTIIFNGTIQHNASQATATIPSGESATFSGSVMVSSAVSDTHYLMMSTDVASTNFSIYSVRFNCRAL